MVLRLPNDEDTVNNNLDLVTFVSMINRIVSYIIRPVVVVMVVVVEVVMLEEKNDRYKDYRYHLKSMPGYVYNR